jgi:putative Holliday junction resolvase
MRYLGLDLGTKTLGLALSDTTLTVATSYKILNFNDNQSTFDELKKTINEYEVTKLVLGFPKNMNNSIGTRAQETMEFKKKLEENLHMEVILEDERLSTVLATNYMLEADLSRKKRKKHVDSLAASIILQKYLDKEKGKKND